MTKEFQLIEKFFKPLTENHKAAQGLSDDVARIALKKDEELVASKDMLVEDVHFLRKNGGFKIASKLLLTNLSDLAAAGAKPLHYMLGFSKNKNTDEVFLREFSRGLKHVQEKFGLRLIGGDTVSAERLFFSVTIFGSVKKGKILSRSQAKDGDLIFVSGSIGDAGLTHHKNFKNFSEAEKKFLLERHFSPSPRILLGQQLLKKKLSICAIDVSDGLLSDLRHICQTSKLDAEIHLEKIPCSTVVEKILKKNLALSKLDLLSSGDDYELIFTSPKKNLTKISDLAKELKLDLTCIGELRAAASSTPKITLRDKKNHKIKIKKFGYEH